MKRYPNTIIYSKSHKKRVFKGLKANSLFTFGTGLRLKKNKYITFEQTESVRKIMVRALRPKGPKETKNQLKLRSRQQKPVFTRKSKKKQIRVLRYVHKRRKVPQFNIRTHIYSPITKKPLQVRMGKGKGNPHAWIAPTQAPKAILEFSRKKLKLKKILRLAKDTARKLPVKTKFIFSRNGLRREHLFRKKK